MSEEYHIELKCKLDSLSDAQREIGELKLVIGFMLAKLPIHDREAVINELRSWGLPEKANEFDQFVHPRPAR